MSKLIEEPFDLQGLCKEVRKRHVDPKEYQKAHPGIEMNGMTGKAACFIGAYELMNFIAQNVKWNKKTRIIVEYDPDQDRFSMVTVTEATEK